MVGDEVSYGVINEYTSTEKFHEPEGITDTPGSPGEVSNLPK
jgi:hypothetical protein